MDKNIIGKKFCDKCNSYFNITDKDLEFYQKISPKFNGEAFVISTPTLCPDCRQQRRLSFFNLSNLYKNTCKKCKKGIVSRFNEESGINNYCNECWSDDSWDKLGEGINIDFSKSFFSQVGYLIKNTNFQNLIGSSQNVENNAMYTNHTSEIHNSYFIFEANKIQNSFYGKTLKNSNDIVDSTCIGNSEYVYESIDSYNLYKAYFTQNSFECRFSYFLNNCNNCSHCIGCINLVNKEYHLFNEPISKEKYEEIISNLSNYDYLIKFKEQVFSFLKINIKKSYNIVGSEDCVGDNIISSKNCKESYDVLECTDCKYCDSINYSNDLYDVSSYGENSNLMYDSVSVGRYSNNILFSSIIGKGDNLIYCIDVKQCKNCFGCVNLKNKEYCILNKQYTKEEYNILVPEIINKMLENGEWGEFFPGSISPFGYNETVANEYYSLNKEEALSEGFNWSDYKSPFPKVEKTIPAKNLPNNIKDIPDDILNWAIECEKTKKPFKIIDQELEFYRKHNLPISRIHPNERHLNRLKQRNDRKIYDGICDKCKKDIITTFSHDCEEIVYCEECFDKNFY